VPTLPDWVHFKPQLNTVLCCIGKAVFLYVFADHLGTPRQVINANKQVRWQWDNTEPFGANPANQNPANLGVFAYNLRFPGQYFDVETGSHYNMFRDFNPQTGRYIESDPIGLSGGLNTFGYVRNNPTNRIDPLGLYDTINCSQKQEKKIEKACPIVQEKANEAGIGKEGSDILDKTTFNCKPPRGREGDCAINYKSIYLIRAFRKECNSLESTIGHEVTHSPPLNYTEDKAFIYEYSAFWTPLPTPETFREQYPTLPADSYSNYDEFYKGIK
jgi:RHS repeat-associated protein